MSAHEKILNSWEIFNPGEKSLLLRKVSTLEKSLNFSENSQLLRKASTLEESRWLTNYVRQNFTYPGYTSNFDSLKIIFWNNLIVRLIFYAKGNFIYIKKNFKIFHWSALTNIIFQLFKSFPCLTIYPIAFLFWVLIIPLYCFLRVDDIVGCFIKPLLFKHDHSLSTNSAIQKFSLFTSIPYCFFVFRFDNFLADYNYCFLRRCWHCWLFC